MLKIVFLVTQRHKSKHHHQLNPAERTGNFTNGVLSFIPRAHVAVLT